MFSLATTPADLETTASRLRTTMRSQGSSDR